MFLQRFLISFTLGPLAFLFIYWGGWWFFIPTTFILLIGAWELRKIWQAMDMFIPIWLLLGGVFSQLITAYLSANDFRTSALVLFVTGGITMTYHLIRYEQGKQKVSAEFLATLGSIFIIGWLGGHFFHLRQLEIGTLVTAVNGPLWTILAVMITWGADSWAFIVGKYMTNRWGLGRHQLTPRLSPNKTVEGFIGSFIISLFFTFIFGVLIFHLPLIPVLILGVFLIPVGTIGDLSVSLLKRESGVKDSGKLFPGHGGALDRLDSLLWCIPLAFYILYFLGNIFG